MRKRLGDGRWRACTAEGSSRDDAARRDRAVRARAGLEPHHALPVVDAGAGGIRRAVGARTVLELWGALPVVDAADRARRTGRHLQRAVGAGAVFGACPELAHTVRDTSVVAERRPHAVLAVAPLGRRLTGPVRDAEPTAGARLGEGGRRTERGLRIARAGAGSRGWLRGPRIGLGRIFVARGRQREHDACDEHRGGSRGAQGASASHLRGVPFSTSGHVSTYRLASLGPDVSIQYALPEPGRRTSRCTNLLFG